MNALSQILPIVIYILLIGLLIIGIIIGIKLIITMNKVEKIVNNVENKVNSLNGLFNIIEITSGKITGVYERIIDIVSGIVDKLFIGKGNRKEDDYE
ncbi:MAG: hypothetical protein E7164_00785 [Firmicutes bacterium]|nr:hypothetical protein [Bacillota bacterium]